jgi:hypothetical protein
MPIETLTRLGTGIVAVGTATYGLTGNPTPTMGAVAGWIGVASVGVTMLITGAYVGVGQGRKRLSEIMQGTLSKALEEIKINHANCERERLELQAEVTNIQTEFDTYKDHESSRIDKLQDQLNAQNAMMAGLFKSAKTNASNIREQATVIEGVRAAVEGLDIPRSNDGEK